MFMHAVLGTHFDYLGCLSRSKFDILDILVISESEEDVVTSEILEGYLDCISMTGQGVSI